MRDNIESFYFNKSTTEMTCINKLSDNCSQNLAEEDLNSFGMNDKFWKKYKDFFIDKAVNISKGELVRCRHSGCDRVM